MSEPLENDVPVEDVAVTTAVEQEPGPEPTEPTEPGKKESDSVAQAVAERRIARLTDQRAKARAEAEYMARQAEDLKARLAKYETPEPAAQTPADPYVLAEQIAEQRLRNMEFSRAADALVAKGHETYQPAEFDGAIKRLQGMGAIFGDNGAPTDVLSAVLECDAPHDVLYYLGAHPDVAEDMVSLPPRALIRAMAKLEAKVAAAPPRVSKAPAPVRPISGIGRMNEPLADADDVVTWMKKREKQLASRK